jgi:hypothetical protein
MRLVPAAAPATGGYPPPSGQGTPAGYGGPAGYGEGAAQYQPQGGAQYEPQGGGQYQPQGGGQGRPRPAGPGGQFQFDRNRLSQADQIVGVASLITMISIWLPWFTVSGFGASGTGSGTAAHGWLWLVFVLDLLILGYLVMRAGWDESPVRLPIAHEPLLIAATGLQLLLVLIAFFDMPSNDGISGISIGWAWGAFIGLLAAIVAAAPVVAPRVRSFLEGRRAVS